MNPLVARSVGLLPVSPIDYVWFDTTTESGFTEIYLDWLKENADPMRTKNFPITELPLPFEKLGLIVTATDPIRRMSGIIPILIERKDSSLHISHHITGDPEPSVQIEISGNLFTEVEGHKLEASVRFNKNYLDFVGLKEADKKDIEMQEDLIELIYFQLLLLCYGIPSQGSSVHGYKLSCTPRQLQVNVKKRIKGKSQLFEWKTVEIKVNPEPKEYVSQGGTHASPKPHDRRGHQRRYKNGKVVFVRSSTVNKHKIETDGFIQHDYKVVADESKPKKGVSIIQSMVEGIKNLFKEKSYERV